MDRNSSTPRPPFRRPTILVGTDTTVLGRPLITPEQATTAGMYGIDLDLRGAWRCPAVDELRTVPTMRIRSVWLPAQYTGPFCEQRAERLSHFLHHAAAQHGLRTIVLPKPGTSRNQGTALTPIARQLCELPRLRIALRVGAETLLKKSGSHLEHVANLRRVAEEWDLDIALDLTARDIERWEAEAALMRLFPRLALTRIRPIHDAGGPPAPISDARTCRRTVSMLADQGYGGIISIAPEPLAPRWLSLVSSPDLVVVTATREEILAAYDRIDQFDATTRESHQRHP